MAGFISDSSCRRSKLPSGLKSPTAGAYGRSVCNLRPESMMQTAYIAMQFRRMCPTSPLHATPRAPQIANPAAPTRTCRQDNLKPLSNCKAPRLPCRIRDGRQIGRGNGTKLRCQRRLRFYCHCSSSSSSSSSSRRRSGSRRPGRRCSSSRSRSRSRSRSSSSSSSSM